MRLPTNRVYRQVVLGTIFVPIATIVGLASGIGAMSAVVAGKQWLVLARMIALGGIYALPYEFVWVTLVWVMAGLVGTRSRVFAGFYVVAIVLVPITLFILTNDWEIRFSIGLVFGALVSGASTFFLARVFDRRMNELAPEQCPRRFNLDKQMPNPLVSRDRNPRERGFRPVNSKR